MEEASVAGESPDRSKQRESSAEPTSGSAGPVPEARSKTRDPRLPASREGGTADRSSSSSESGSHGGVDTATRVFSVRRSETGDIESAGSAEATDDAEATEGTDDGSADGVREAEDADGAEGAVKDSDSADAASGTEDSEDREGDGDDATGDARLRAAVAAWVQSAEDATSSETVTQDAAESDDAEKPGRASTAAAESEQAAEGAGKAGDTAEDAQKAERATAEADPAEQDEQAADDSESAGHASTGSEAGERDAEAAEEGEQAAEGSEKAGGASTGAGKAGRASAGAQEAESAVGAAGDRDAEDVQDTPEAPEADEAAGAGARGGADREPRTEEDSATDTDTDEPGSKATGGAVKAGAEGDAPSKADPRSDTDQPAEADSDSPAKAETKPADKETPTKADPRVGTDTAAKADSKPSTDTSAKADAKPEADAEPTADADTESGPDSDGSAKPTAPPVDQPTAVFKAPRVGKREVDQPTTMLKLGDAGKAAQKAGRKPEGEADDKAEGTAGDKAEGKAGDKAAEAEAERTSKFVALKPLDDPATRKPPPADATTALPRVKPAEATSPVPQVGPERTTQQPLPPKPPLDLLAELTNTPPPAETTLRTSVRRVKIWTPIVLLLAVVFAIVQAVRPLPTPTLALTAEESYTFKGDKVSLPWPSEGQGWMDVNGIGTVDGFGDQKPVAIGSVAKAMTAYVVLKDHALKRGTEGPSIPIDALAEKEGGYDKYDESTVNTVKKGDKYTLRQALSAVMIPSANNIARLLARWDAGSEAAFIKKMNDTAKELGMTNTKYTDASGLKETTVSTAHDQVKLGHELVKIPALMDITKLPNWVDPTGFKWRNYNDLVPYNGAIGIKTGSTTKAGGNLLFAATKEVGGETVTLVGAVLGQHNAPSIIDLVNKVSKTAMLATQDALTSEKILKAGDVVGYVDDKFGNRTPVVVTKDVSAVGWAGLKVKLSFATDDVPHTAKAGTKVGSLSVGDGSGDAVNIPVALQKDLAEPGFADKLTRVG
ncbi:D-alanyl-D-alanine carboxypeptidase [Streptomyces sp. NPDC002888]|uniref:D-alanyl-D-alanine carboxypeptidase n=1 Tax=Streptomyces sp. NPDC002888 TaxID=3364668 RepID=UPI0036A1A4F7